MECVYAVLMLHQAKQEINEANVKKVLEAAGAKVDDAKVKAMIASLEGVNIEEAIKKAVVAAPAAAPEKKEEKKKPEEEKKTEEEAAGGLAALFSS
jgi:large subunit ribosomal protein L12